MPQNRALLLDRDGVINHDHGYIGSIERFDFRDGLFSFLRTAQDQGYRLAILTNQAGVARGYYTASDHAAVTAHMRTRFAREGIHIDLDLVCFEHPEGTIPAYRRESFWRKPNPGMVLDAVRQLNLNPAASAFIGDSLRDMQAAQAGGIGTCLWLTDQKPTPPAGVKIITAYDQVWLNLSV